MKKVMILGAGNGQMPLINICKKRGYEVIVVSIVGDYPGFYVADKVYNFDTRDKESILAAAEKEKIDAIMTDQTDVAVPTVAYVAEKLGLRGIGVECAKKFTNKYEMRKAAKVAGIAVPDFEKTNNIYDGERIADYIGYPVIIKPVDSSGSRGVYRLNNKKDLYDYFENSLSFSNENEVIIEQFINGKEYLADGFCMNGYHTLDVGEKEYFNSKDIFVSSMCIFSSVKCLWNNESRMVKEVNDALIKAFKLPFGITHAEYIFSRQKVYLVECAARGGGVYLSSHLTPRACGFNTNEALVDYLVEGKMTQINKNNIAPGVSAWVCFSFPDGILTSIKGVELLEQIKGVDDVFLDDIKIGMKTKKLENDSGKYGPILISGDTKESVYDTIKKVRQTLKMEISTTKNLKKEGLIW